MPQPQDLIGCIVNHQRLGLARIDELEKRFIVLLPFENPTKVRLSLPAALDDFERYRFPEGSRANSPDGLCSIERWHDGTSHVYSVLREDGVRDDVPETELEPLEEPLPTSIVERFVRLDFDKYRFFKSREKRIQAFEDLEKRVRRLHAQLSSRIDVYPHQASVAGEIQLDSYMASNLWPAAVGAVAASLLDGITDPHIDVLAVGAYLLSGANP